MQSTPLPPNDDPNQKQFVLTSISERLKNMTEFAKICECEAKRSSGFKRTGRWMNGLLGGLTALIGVIVTTLPPGNDSFARSLGLAGAMTGSIIGTVGQFLDPTKSRQRAIDLQSLSVDLNNLTEENTIVFLGLRNANPKADELIAQNTTELIALNKTLIDKFTEIQNKAFTQGVKV